MLLSFAVHLFLLVLLIVVGMRSQIGGGSADVRRVDLVLAEVNEREETQYLTETEETEASDQASEAMPSQLPTSETPPTELDTPKDSLEPNADVPQLDAAGMTELPNVGPRQSREIVLSEADREMIAEDRARFSAQAEKGEKVDLQVFGSGRLSGRTFVFALDRSKSMGSQGLGVLDRAANQLSSAVQALKPHHSFQIVAYHHGTTVLNERKLLPADEETKQQVLDFISNLAPFGATKHASALSYALAFRPDIVVLMTDGGLPGMNESQLERIRRTSGHTQIHCIQFGAGPRQSRGGFMERLAAENNGSYRYIDVNQWNRD